MTGANRDILVLLDTDRITEQEVDNLHRLLHQIETPENFCRAHELVDRDRIVRRTDKILLESRHYALRSFRFLINKN